MIKEHDHNRRIRKPGGLMAVLLVSAMLSSPLTAFGAPPYDNIPEGLTEERYEQLCDDTVEWDEIEDLIRYFSPTYTSYQEQAMSAVDDLHSSLGEDMINFRDQLDQLDDTLEGLYESQTQIESSMPEGSPMREEALKQLGDAIRQAEDGRTTLEDSIDSLYDLDAQIDGRLYVSGSQSVSRDSIEIQLYPVMEQLRSVIEGLVISYGQLSASRDIYA